MGDPAIDLERVQAMAERETDRALNTYDASSLEAAVGHVRLNEMLCDLLTTCVYGGEEPPASLATDYLDEIRAGHVRVLEES